MANSYFLTAGQLRIVKRLAEATGLPWRTIAARPAVAIQWVEHYSATACDIKRTLELIAADSNTNR